MALTPQQTYQQQSDPGDFLQSMGITPQTNPNFFQYDPGTAGYDLNNAGQQYAQMYGQQYSSPVADQSTNAGGGSFTWADGTTGHQYGVEGPFPGTPYSPTGAVGQAWLTAHGVAPGTQWEQIPPDVQAQFQQYIPTVAPHAATGLSALLADPGVQMLAAFAGGTLAAGLGGAGTASDALTSSYDAAASEDAAIGAGMNATEAGTAAGATGATDAAANAVGNGLDNVGAPPVGQTPAQLPTISGPQASLSSQAGLDTADTAGSDFANGVPGSSTATQLTSTQSTTLTQALQNAGLSPAQAAQVAQVAPQVAQSGASSVLQRILSGTGTASDIGSLITAATPLISSLATGGNTPGTTGSASAQTAADIANQQWQYYVQNYQPLETNLINQANTAGSPDEFARAEGAANADVTGAFNNAQKQTANQLQSYGLNPGAPAYQAAMGSTALAQGAATAGALTTADNNTRNLAYQKALDVTEVGKGIPAQSQSGATAASNAQNQSATTNSNLNTAQQQSIGYGLNSLGQLVGSAANWFGSPAPANASQAVTQYGASNVAMPSGSSSFNTGDANTALQNDLNTTDPFSSAYARGGEVMDPREQAAYKNATGDDINAVGSTSRVVQPGNGQVAPNRQQFLNDQQMRQQKTQDFVRTHPELRRQMGYAKGGRVHGLDSVLAKRGINPRMRQEVITPHMRRFASGGGVGDQGNAMPDQSNTGMPNDVSSTSQPVNGVGTGTSDSIPASIDGQQPAALSNGEFVMNAEVPKLSGDEILAAINNAGLKKRQQQGLNTAPPPQPPMQPPMDSNTVSPNAGTQAYRGGGRVMNHGLGA